MSKIFNLFGTYLLSVHLITCLPVNKKDVWECSFKMNYGGQRKYRQRHTFKTRMHSSRMRTARSLIVSPYLVVSHACPPGATTHAPPGATMHAPPGATTHAPQSNHTHPPEQPCTPPGSNHAHPPVNRITDACENITLPQLRCGR